MPYQEPMPGSAGHNPERRAYSRTVRTEPVRLHVAPPEGWIPVTLQGDLLNVSRGGALISADGVLSRDQCCLIEMTADQKRAPAVGRVKRVKPGNGNDVLLSIEFTRPLPTSQS